MQEIYLCRYVGSSGERVGSMNGDRLYDLNLCAVTQLSEDYDIKDAYRLANRLVPANLREFLRGFYCKLVFRTWIGRAGARARASRTYKIVTLTDEMAHG